MPHIYLFHGENSYTSSQKIKHWQKEFTRKYSHETLEIIDGNNINLSEFITNIGALPLFSEKRLIIIKDFLEEADAEDQKKIAESLDSSAEECIIVFYETKPADKRTSLYKKISQIGEVTEFNPPHPATISKWIFDEAQKRKINISFANANYLGQFCGSDLWSLNNELEKLKTHANGREITQQMIEDISISSLSSSIFKLTDAIAQKNQKQSLKIFSILCESGEELMGIFFMIVRHFRILLQVQDLISKGEKTFNIGKKLQQHPFVIQKTAEQSRNFNSQKLEKIHNDLLEIDHNFKTGLIKTYATDNRELMLAIEKLIINCCQPA
ncbi:DNA polymerase III subunit delta [Candidatus Peregrinibacteria bacterium]|nr:DNA polymerase III subunit delta [Candidatus Peregrinibacteria bacterium]